MTLPRDGRENRPDWCGEEEWALRLQLAATYHVFDHLGWIESIFNHITVRVPGPEAHYLINPFGLNYNEVTASNLIRIDLDGHAHSPSRHPVNRAGFVIHSAIHAARPDAHCIVHTHTDTGMAVACKDSGISYDNFYGAQLYGRVAYHEFEGITVHAEEQPRLVASLGDKSILVLRNHGLLVAEESLPKAFWLAWTLQRACDVQCAAESHAGASRGLSAAVRKAAAHDGEHFDPTGALGRTMLDAAIRRMEMARAGLHVDFRQ
ncbi:class II aldolase/adducin family protein [Rhodoplanes serenus]|jgi:ribulose-5-phosphate 4-epimerase/fuculose-1-phosphate aldolase|uniref:Class II aldolase/adducin family protein n=1 Tax=Rhodoplanes serenus TaxID=200615 RepID=A0A9X5AQL9_9BRAD|nr:class II aldolase/adducin family protein [Rhodoplanes serenus]MTW15196.1 class II aldolase/adducin family protein [Rhodoplanes serenus]